LPADKTDEAAASKNFATAKFYAEPNFSPSV
jgi:hypothetical protein